jgi:hypothetical protein
MPYLVAEVPFENNIITLAMTGSEAGAYTRPHCQFHVSTFVGYAGGVG